jgi:hypothetical protein
MPCAAPGPYRCSRGPYAPANIATADGQAMRSLKRRSPTRRMRLERTTSVSLNWEGGGGGGAVPQVHSCCAEQNCPSLQSPSMSHSVWLQSTPDLSTAQKHCLSKQLPWSEHSRSLFTGQPLYGHTSWAAGHGPSFVCTTRWCLQGLRHAVWHVSGPMQSHMCCIAAQPFRLQHRCADKRVQKRRRCTRTYASATAHIHRCHCAHTSRPRCRYTPRLYACLLQRSKAAAAVGARTASSVRTASSAACQDDACNDWWQGPHVGHKAIDGSEVNSSSRGARIALPVVRGELLDEH